jgi:hypothetical protein
MNRIAVPPIGLAGRVIAAAGALLLIASLFVEAYSDSLTYWDAYERIQYLVLILALAALALLLLSLFRLAEPLLFLVGVIGGFGLGRFLADVIEFGDFGEGRGIHLAWVGSAGLVLGAAVALAPSLFGRTDWQAQAFAPAPTPVVESTPEAPAPPPPSEAEPRAPEPAAAAAPAPGWYADPTGGSRLRYWDGQSWTEHTHS